MRKLLLRFIGFVGVGAIATGIQYLILIGLAGLAGASPVYASAIGYAIAAICNYLMKYHWVFASTRAHRHAAPRYAVISGIGFSINTALMHLGIVVLGWYYLLVQLATTGVVLIWNFAANSLWTFNESRHATQRPELEQTDADEPSQRTDRTTDGF